MEKACFRASFVRMGRKRNVCNKQQDLACGLGSSNSNNRSTGRVKDITCVHVMLLLYYYHNHHHSNSANILDN